MARPSKNYDAEKFGTFELMPEGVYKMTVKSGIVTYGKNNDARWELELEPVDVQYRTGRAMKVWLNEDGCVNALYDAGGVDPRSVPDKDFEPHKFVGKVVSAEVFHKPGKENPEVKFANVRRLYPVFSMGNQSKSQQSQSQAMQTQQPAREPISGFDDNPDSIPF